MKWNEEISALNLTLGLHACFHLCASSFQLDGQCSEKVQFCITRESRRGGIMDEAYCRQKISHLGDLNATSLCWLAHTSTPTMLN